MVVDYNTQGLNIFWRIASALSPHYTVARYYKCNLIDHRALEPCFVITTSFWTCHNDRWWHMASAEPPFGVHAKLISAPLPADLHSDTGRGAVTRHTANDWLSAVSQICLGRLPYPRSSTTTNFSIFDIAPLGYWLRPNRRSEAVYGTLFVLYVGLPAPHSRRGAARCLSCAKGGPN